MGVLRLLEGDTISFGRYTVSQDIPFNKDVLLVWQLCERYSTVSSRKRWHLIYYDGKRYDLLVFRTP